MPSILSVQITVQWHEKLGMHSLSQKTALSVMPTSNELALWGGIILKCHFSGHNSAKTHVHITLQLTNNWMSNFMASTNHNHTLSNIWLIVPVTLYSLLLLLLCVCVCVRACVGACVGACVRACVHVCVCTSHKSVYTFKQPITTAEIGQQLVQTVWPKYLSLVSVSVCKL